MENFVKVAAKKKITSGKMKEFNVGNETIVIANIDEAYFAFAGLCTHVGCPLAGGYLKDHTVTCYCHGAQFDITNGKVLAPPAPKPLKIYEVKVEGEDILIKI